MRTTQWLDGASWTFWGARTIAVELCQPDSARSAIHASDNDGRHDRDRRFHVFVVGPPIASSIRSDARVKLRS